MKYLHIKKYVHEFFKLLYKSFEKLYNLRKSFVPLTNSLIHMCVIVCVCVRALVKVGSLACCTSFLHIKMGLAFGIVAGPGHDGVSRRD